MDFEAALNLATSQETVTLTLTLIPTLYLRRLTLHASHTWNFTYLSRIEHVCSNQE